MKNIIIGLIICAVGNNHIFGNVALIEQDNTYTFKITDEETAQDSSFNDQNDKSILYQQEVESLINDTLQTSVQ